MLALGDHKQQVKTLLSRHLAITPWLIQLEVTNACNMRCSMCPTNSPEAIERRPNVMLDFGLFTKIIDEAATFHRCHIVPQGGGEPMIHPRFLEMLAYIKSKPNLTIGFVTNGSRLKPEVIEQLLDLGVEEICVSIDAFSRERFFEITKKDCYDFVVEAVRSLVRRRRERGLKYPIIKVQRVAMPGDTADLRAFEAYWAGIVDEVLILKERDLTGRMVKGFNPTGQQRRACRKPFEEAAIGADGNLVLCCDDWHEHQVMGNLKTQTLREAWFGAKFRSARKNHKEGQFQVLDICANCYALYEKHPQTTFDDNRIIEEGLSVIRVRQRSLS